MASVKIALFGLLVACGGDKQTSTDAPTQSADCSGTSDRFVLQGAVAVDSTSFGFVTVNSKIAGVQGSSSGDIVSFNLRNVITSDLEADRDVGSANLMFFREPLAGCNGGGCSGFYALAGSYHVIALTPRYQATFTLSDLHERNAAADPPGAAIAGTITGCVNHAPP